MRHRIFIIAAFVTLLSCNDASYKKDAADAPGTDTVITENINPVMAVSECYTNTKSKDSIMLKLIINNNIVTGNMNYQIDGKDENKGTLQGEMRGDTLFADYTFMSEGIQSIRQVAYLKRDNSLSEGYGDVEEKENKMVFKNTGKLNFGKGVVLAKTACR